MTSHLLRRMLTTVDMAYHTRGQGRYPFKPLPQILFDQRQRLRRMILCAYRTVPYYRETMQRLGLRPSGFQSAEDLCRLPLLTREDVRSDPQYYTSTAKPLARYVRLDSSGTTSWQTPFYHDARSLCLNRAYGARARAVYLPLLGRQWGYRQAKILGPGGAMLRVELFVGEQTWLPRRVRLERQLLSFANPLQRLVEDINGFAPDVLWSPGSFLDLLFRHLRSTGQEMCRPKAILFGGDELPAPARRRIESEFGIPVFGGFGAVEAPSIGFECERHSGYHINIDLCALRVTDDDGRTLPAGQSGHIAISNLLNRGTVLLNYRLGDVAILQHAVCSCGRTLPRLVELQGRSEDFVQLPSGERIHPFVIYTAFRREPEVIEWQLVQDSSTRVTVSIVPAASCDLEVLSRRITCELTRAFGGFIAVDVSFVEAVPRTPAGKVRAVISLTGEEDMPHCKAPLAGQQPGS